MSSRILTASVIGVDAFNDDPDGVLKKAENGTVAVFANNAPAFYAIMPARLAQLLDLEAKLARPGSDVALDGALFNDPAPAPVAVPLGKFAMYDGWQPDAEFQRPPRRRSWRRSSPTGRRKAKCFTTCSGSRSWPAACKLAAPATTASRSAI